MRGDDAERIKKHQWIFKSKTKFPVNNINSYILIGDFKQSNRNKNTTISCSGVQLSSRIFRDLEHYINYSSCQWHLWTGIRQIFGYFWKIVYRCIYLCSFQKFFILNFTLNIIYFEIYKDGHSFKKCSWGTQIFKYPLDCLYKRHPIIDVSD